MIYLLNLISLLIFLSCVGPLSATSSGCGASNTLPGKPFVVVWNHPDAGCEKHGIDLGFDKWGIIDNYHDNFFGENMNTFYGIGAMPHITKNGSYFNGGIPQLGNLTYHLNEIKSDLDNKIHNKDFSGLGVLDHELWRATYAQNFGGYRKYRLASLDLVRKKFPLFNHDQQVAEAAKEFDEGARTFLQGTILQVRKLRPNGQWGFYGYPRCWDKSCNTTTLSQNDQLRYIWNISTGLFPSLYWHKYDQNISKEVYEFAVKKTIHETLRLKAKFGLHNASIFPFSLMQNSPTEFFSKEDLDISITEPANIGASGVVQWGSSRMLHTPHACQNLKTYINDIFGPFVLNVTNFFGNCSEQLCNGHGRCIRKDYESISQHYLRESKRKSCLIKNEYLVMGQSLEVLEKQRERKIKENKQKGGSLLFKPFWNYDKKNIGIDPMSSKLNTDGSASHRFHVVDNESSLDYEKRSSNLGYDFDDYVCRCFNGWSGIRCNQND